MFLRKKNKNNKTKNLQTAKATQQSDISTKTLKENLKYLLEIFMKT